MLSHYFGHFPKISADSLVSLLEMILKEGRGQQNRALAVRQCFRLLNVTPVKLERSFIKSI